MSGSFSSHLWRQAVPIWEEIASHPFLFELQNGSLDIEKFRFYILQDYLYLGAFGRAAAAALSQAPDTNSARRLLRRITTPVERPLHSALFNALGLTDEDAEASKPSPTNLAYMNHIEVSMDMGGLPCGVAALLPCPSIYHEVGKILREPDHPIYSVWQSTYADGLLEASVIAWSGFVDEIAQDSGPHTRDMMEEAYMLSSRYEFMFWSMAYNLEDWPA